MKTGGLRSRAICNDRLVNNKAHAAVNWLLTAQREVSRGTVWVNVVKNG